MWFDNVWNIEQIVMRAVIKQHCTAKAFAQKWQCLHTHTYICKCMWLLTAVSLPFCFCLLTVRSAHVLACILLRAFLILHEALPHWESPKRRVFTILLCWTLLQQQSCHLKLQRAEYCLSHSSAHRLSVVFVCSSAFFCTAWKK